MVASLSHPSESCLLLTARALYRPLNFTNAGPTMPLFSGVFWVMEFQAARVASMRITLTSNAGNSSLQNPEFGSMDSFLKRHGKELARLSDGYNARRKSKIGRSDPGLETIDKTEVAKVPGETSISKADDGDTPIERASLPRRSISFEEDDRVEDSGFPDRGARGILDHTKL